MTAILGRAGALACALLAAASPAGPAMAQTFGGNVHSNISTPAEHLAVTPGGVDIRSGQYAYSQTDISIGEDNESGGLALTRTMMSDAPWHINPFGNFSHNWNIFLVETRVDIEKKNYEAGSGQDFRLSVYYGGRAETFEVGFYNSGTGLAQTSLGPRALLSHDPATGTRQSATVVYTFTANDGTVAVFRPIGNKECSGISVSHRCAFVSQITRPDGTRFTLDYDSQPGVGDMTRLRRVTSSRGYALLINYDPAAFHVIARACVINLALAVAPADNVCPANAAATSSYVAGTELASATDAAGGVWGFTYTPGPQGNQTQIGFVRPGETAPWLVNIVHIGATSEGGRRYTVDRQVFADGSSYTYDYASLADQTEATITDPVGGLYTDALGHETHVDYEAPRRPISLNPPPADPLSPPESNFGDAYYQLTPGPTRITDPLGRVTTFDYCDRYLLTALPASDTVYRCVVTLLQSHTDPMGIRTELFYDGVRNVSRVVRHAAPGSGLADIETQATYDCMQMVTCAKPNRTVDARGNATVYVYASEHGGLLSETGPAPSAGAPQPQTRHSYAQRYAWISNGGGGYVQAAAPIWVRTATSSCRTSAATGDAAAPCATAGDEVRTDYDYGPNSGPNNLLLRGQVVTSTDGGVTTSLRTCYGYDARGRRISETQPNANLASCP